MSDSEDFDKEAEREKLREQFEREQEKREVTERMSDLLLKGATMTNKHCPECGSPVFRHEDQEFCPTCQRPVQTREAEDDQQPQSDQRPRAESDAAAADKRPAEPTERAGVTGDDPSTEAASDAGGLATAERSLARTLTALARQAEETEDVGRKREYLGAAREAAEALAATRRARR